MKSRSGHPLQRFPVRCEGFALTGKRVIRKHVQLARGHDAWIELADSSRGGVPRIREPGLALLFTLDIDLFELGARNESFAADFEFFTRTFLVLANAQRNTANRANVQGDVFSGAAV